MQILDRPPFYLEEVTDLAVGVALLADPVELEVRDPEPCALGLVRELWILREKDAVGRGLDTEESDLLRVGDGL